MERLGFDIVTHLAVQLGQECETLTGRGILVAKDGPADVESLSLQSNGLAVVSILIKRGSLPLGLIRVHHLPPPFGS